MSSITLSNETRFLASFFVRSDGKLMGKLPVLPPNGSLAVPTGSHEVHTVYCIGAVINGVTTDEVSTPNPNARIRAVAEDSGVADGYYRLIVA